MIYGSNIWIILPLSFQPGTGYLLNTVLDISNYLAVISK